MAAMTTPVKVGGYGLLLAAVFGAALAVGSAVGPVSAAGSGSHKAEGASSMSAMTASMGTVQGLAVSAGGYTFAPASTMLPAGATTTFTFRILGPDRAPVTAYTLEHDKQLHFIVVRRDLTGYQHLHPTRADDGTWSVPLRLAEPGGYKAFADFQPAGAAMPMTLAVDLSAPGTFTPVPLPPPARTAQVDGYTVTLTGRPIAGRESDLTFAVVKNGQPVRNLQPYLAAYGHLVALRVGDLAYSHVHPDGEPGDGHTPAGPRITFHAVLPTAGAYRLFLDFKHGGTVHTAEFTVTTAATGK